MSPHALERARKHLADAESYLARLAQTDDLEEVEHCWGEVLIHSQRAMSKLAAGATGGKSQPWFGRTKKERQDDELLQYAHQARHADEHGIERITEVDPWSLGVGAADPAKDFYIKEMIIEGGKLTSLHGPNIRAEVKPASIKLVPVVNKKVRFNLPTKHLGADWGDNTPSGIGRALLSYTRSKIEEAEKFIV